MPPLKPSQTGKMWPINAPKPAAIVAGIHDDAEPEDIDDGSDLDVQQDDDHHHSLSPNDDGTDADIIQTNHDDAEPAPADTHTALVADDDSTGA